VSSGSKSQKERGKGEMDLAELTNTLVDLLRSQKDGLSNEDLERYFGARFAALPPILNNLLDLKRLNLYTRDGNLLYKLVEEETAAKFEGLGDQQILVYQVCEKAGSRGVWTRDIKTATNIPQHTLTKTLKLLEQRNLIKSVRSVVSKSKKLYMLYDIVPAKEITGGPWYTDQEFDQAFVDDLTATILHDCKGNQQLDRKGILDKLSGRAIEQSTLSLDELDTLLQTLVYDKQLESIKTAPALGAAR